MKGNVTAAMTAVTPDSTALSPVAGLGVFLAYPAVILAVAAFRMRHRDA